MYISASGVARGQPPWGTPPGGAPRTSARHLSEVADHSYLLVVAQLRRNDVSSRMIRPCIFTTFKVRVEDHKPEEFGK